MRPFLLSLGLFVAALGAARAQGTPGSGTGGFQISFGQIYKDFQLPIYQNDQIADMIYAVSAKGITVNRAQTTDLRIDLYTNGKVTTTITSPNADVYISERVMRTKNTVKIERADMEATAQSCDFDLNSKKYLLRQNVRVVLKNFDAGGSAKPATRGAAAAAAQTAATPSPAPADSEDDTMPVRPRSGQDSGDLLEMPGATSSTNAIPVPTPGTVTP
jgi:hypothetical protein